MRLQLTHEVCAARSASRRRTRLCCTSGRLRPNPPRAVPSCSSLIQCRLLGAQRTTHSPRPSRPILPLNPAAQACSILSQQTVEQRHNRSPESSAAVEATGWDPQRTVRMVGFYSILQMPFVHVWFGFLERRFGPVTLLTNAPLFLAKIVTDQAIGVLVSSLPPRRLGCS